MERHEVLEMMAALKLAGMRDAFDEVLCRLSLTKRLVNHASDAQRRHRRAADAADWTIGQLTGTGAAHRGSD